MNNTKAENPVLTLTVSWLVIILLISQVILSTLTLHKIDPSLFTIVINKSNEPDQNEPGSSGEQVGEIPSLFFAGDIPIDKDDFVIGDLKTAQITIVEFGDYECPFCAKAHHRLSDLLESYPSQIAFVFYDFPLSQHENALPAAEAAHCAGDQEKFWEMHDLLYSDQSRLDLESIKTRAEELELDLKRFDACIESHKYREEIENNISKGQKLGVDGTPTIFVNGYQFNVSNLSLIEAFVKGK